MIDAAGAEDCKRLFERLATAPRRCFEVCSGAAKERLAQPIGPGKWSPLQLIRHLTGCDREALLPRIEKMLALEDPLLPDWDEDRWMKLHGDVRGQSAVQLIDEWARLREKIALLLFDLAPGDWMRTGRHETRGSLTVYALCAYHADHDEHHIAQIARHASGESRLNPTG